MRLFLWITKWALNDPLIMRGSRLMKGFLLKIGRSRGLTKWDEMGKIWALEFPKKDVNGTKLVILIEFDIGMLFVT